MKKVLLKIYMWFFWNNFLTGLKTVLGHKTLASAIKEMESIAAVIRLENNLKIDEKITWDNSKVTEREMFAKYITLKHFREIGELLVFFKNVDKNKIMEMK